MEEESEKDHRALLNQGEENELEVFGYHTQHLRRALCLIASVLTGGVLQLLFYWRPEWRLRCIQVQKIRYVWDYLEKRFQKVGLLEDSNSCYDIHQTFGLGLTNEEQEVRRLVCGPNAIEVEIQPIWKLLVKQQSVKLHNLVEDHNKVQVTILVKDKGLQELESRLLVPGDILILPGKLSLPCDAVLIDGSCVVNEGMLTGESIPVTKTPLPGTENTMPWKCHSLEDYRKHVLFCGTEVIQVKPSGQGPIRAVVLQTGYNTAKGDLVRSILYPRPLNFKLYSDAFKFLVFLACLGVVGFFYALGIYMYHEIPPRDTATMALILLTVTVPPVLPAALTIGIVDQGSRLEQVVSVLRGLEKWQRGSMCQMGTLLPRGRSLDLLFFGDLRNFSTSCPLVQILPSVLPGNLACVVQ
ncbi:Hypothetical predicted protein [Marmota monax]|uniref:Cation-transporting ATPase n=1 Tax=Marmota monax TaxID=9995 RepID=A0A5E4ALM1_MARMO|nr:hypothetical protein GHT09_006832 [Marmota monax]VTJ57646.1 Hypothetical predicted protein [Marmota monax]